MLRHQGKLYKCRRIDMARVFYKCRNDLELGNDNAFKPCECIAVHRQTCNLQHPSAVQRRPPRHLLEAWYFWLGIALLVASADFSVFHPVDVTHILTGIDETIGGLINQGLIKIRYR
ncbi:hypothetical protein PUN28_018728 [Cardiocondyla obscurior]|uniref:Uncharacterized protein n=1 Tax=Cardiocondyla obscurior TaxID=286306 RepID=A0AAW2EDP1_9HYME